MTTYAYDIECFRNLFTATFVNVDDISDQHVFYTGMERQDYSDIKTFLNQDMLLIGYNNHSYDDPLLRFIMDYEGEKLPQDAFVLSSKLIDDGYRQDRQVKDLRYPRNRFYAWNSIDLMRIMAFDKIGVSLKQTAIHLKWHKIQDIPLSPIASVPEDKLDLILAYNLNDVLITKRFYEEITPTRELRMELSRLYSVNLTSASDSKVANMILENIYSNQLRKDIRAIRELRTPREKVLLRTCIADFVHFESPELNDMLDRIKGEVLYAYNHYRYRDTVYFANCAFSLGVGGLHSVDTAGKFITDDKYLIQDMDVSSYYPNLIINNKFYPAHLGPDFIEVLKRITQERMQAKKEGDEIKADGLKITINSIFGKMGSEHFWLYDPKQFLSTTISGQMGLMMLIEGMYRNGIEVISCNTDGIVCKIEKEKLDTYYVAAKEWEEKTGLELDFTPYKKYIRRDVNSYIAEKENGETKEKGAFVGKIDLNKTYKAYRMPIVARALQDYFIEDVPVRQTLEASKDIMDFCISQKSGDKFAIEIHYGNEIKQQQKTNRFYITNDGGALLKRNIYTNKLTGQYVGFMVNMLNDYDENVPFEDYNVNLSFYEKEARKIIDEIEPKQMTLFEVSFDNMGKKTKMNAPSREINIEDKNDFVSLNKLGKNQLMRKLDSIVAKGKTIDNISPRYVYIMDFDARKMIAEVYCLTKGVRQKLGVNKHAYKGARLETGQLVYCDKFEKTKHGYEIATYHIAEKLKQVGEKLI